MASVAAVMAGAAATSLAPCRLTPCSSSVFLGRSSGQLFVSVQGSVRRSSSYGIRSMAEPDQRSNSEATPATPVTPVSPLPTAAAPSKPAAPKVSTNFEDVFAFSGPAPETINGRLAMLGFVAGLIVELGTGNDLVSQLNMGGTKWFILSAILFSVASLIPMFKGVSADSRSKSFFSSQAETWNGRMAMVGLVALVITEYVKGSPLV